MIDLRKIYQGLREKFTQLQKVPSEVDSSVSVLLELYVPTDFVWVN